MLVAIAALCISSFSFAQIEGKWKTVDDETGQAKSIVEITKKPNGQYSGKIVKLLQKPETENCVNCTGDRKNKPILGMEIIRGLKKSGDEFLRVLENLRKTIETNVKNFKNNFSVNKNEQSDEKYLNTKLKI